MKKLNLESKEGYVVSKVAEAKEFQAIKELIMDKWWLQCKKNLDETLWNSVMQGGIEKYHNNFDDVKHKKMWPKKARMLNKTDISRLHKTKVFSNIKEFIGPFEISDEENIGYPNIYWRIVRPNKPQDVGPIHRDEWFWELNKQYKLGEFKKRIKIWMPIVVEKGESGLMIEAYSHTRDDIKWSGEARDGINKPVILTDKNDLNLELINTSEGDAIIFHDRILHAGKLNTGKQTRVSLEFTAIVAK